MTEEVGAVGDIGFLVTFFLTPVLIWAWREEIVNLVSDCIAEGLRKHEEDE